MSHLLKNLLIALCITIVLGVLYATLFKGGDDEEVVESAPLLTEDGNLVKEKTEKLLADIRIVDSYQIEGALFDNEAFRTLRDFHVPIEDVPTGRDNPFQAVE